MRKPRKTNQSLSALAAEIRDRIDAGEQKAMQAHSLVQDGKALSKRHVDALELLLSEAIDLIDGELWRLGYLAAELAKADKAARCSSTLPTGEALRPVESEIVTLVRGLSPMVQERVRDALLQLRVLRPAVNRN